MGGRAALLHACKQPQFWDALILISTNPGIENPEEKAVRAKADAEMALRIENSKLEAFLNEWQATPILRSQQDIRSDWRQSMRLNRLQHSVQGLANSMRDFGQGSFPNLWPQLDRLDMPILLLTGASDSKYTDIARQIKTRLGNRPVSHRIIPEAGHMPQLEAPVESIQAIRTFLGQVGY